MNLKSSVLIDMTTVHAICTSRTQPGIAIKKIRASFRSKLLMLTIVPLAVAQIFTLFAVMRTVENDVENRARNSLAIGGNVIDEYLATRGQQLRTSVEVLASDFGLKQAAATSDSVTIRSVLDNHSLRVGADLALFLDLDGVAVAGTSNTLTSSTYNYERLIRLSGNSDATQSTLLTGDEIFQTFAVPLNAPVQIGWVVLGFRIDQAMIRSMNALTGLEVVISTSPPPASRSVYTVKDSGLEWLRLSVPFVGSAEDVNVILQRSMQEAMLPYAQARSGLVIFTIVLLALVAVAAGYVSGGIARPVRVLTAAAGRMISGNYDTAIDVSSDDEFGELASSFNAMRTAISDRTQRISHQALYDPVTDLPNRRNISKYLANEIASAEASGNSVSVLSIRLQRMNSIASTLGYSASDEVITLAAKHLQVNLNAGEALGHVGTYEFVLIIPDSDENKALATADRIESILGAGVTLGRINITLHPQIGIAGFPQHGSDVAELLRNAAIARSEAETRQEHVVVYQAGRQEHYVRQLRIVNDLRGALRSDQISLVFQPKISLPDGKFCGVEALVRWHHPEFGFLSPDEFIPAAEEAGTIVHLTRYVLARSIRYCREWEDQGITSRISVNLSARDLQDEYLPYFVLQELKSEDIQANRLTLEITENTVMEDVNHAVSVLECLRDIGVKISIDDFGTGHSSLAQLKNIPLHELKIDKSFIMNMLEDEQNAAIVLTTIQLAHHMGLDVVAEGVEDEETLRQLSDAGCEQAQGYLLSKPISSADLLRWVREYRPKLYRERRTSTRAFAKNV
jgi:diguanylate cyclase (GGDEF)-like protein